MLGFHLLVCLFGMESCSVVQAGGQWCDIGSLPPLTSGFKQFSFLSFPCSWDYMVPPPCPASFVFSVEMGFHHVGQAGLKLLTSGDPDHHGLPNCWDYRYEPPCLAKKKYLYWGKHMLQKIYHFSHF